MQLHAIITKLGFHNPAMWVDTTNRISFQLVVQDTIRGPIYREKTIILTPLNSVKP